MSREGAESGSDCGSDSGSIGLDFAYCGDPQPRAEQRDPDSGAAPDDGMHFSDDYCTEVKPRILLMGLRRSDLGFPGAD
ncbi:ras-related GTP-binding protein D-like [Callorhinchus milii]|uniref:ras-related GTP-binding protein D-like n=1 Tax=Callorhinchus milii TaxID=7868 RepID=UPI001C3FF238|nr:ras-related GTP-binding protein D-like [Callorhinchus milii]